MRSLIDVIQRVGFECFFERRDSVGCVIQTLFLHDTVGPLHMRNDLNDNKVLNHYAYLTYLVNSDSINIEIKTLRKEVGMITFIIVMIVICLVLVIIYADQGKEGVCADCGDTSGLTYSIHEEKRRVCFSCAEKEWYKKKKHSRHT